tara:strand:- start:105 stop:305 length:201 start_codon:yes stop_codon:yes gene_type:complete
MSNFLSGLIIFVIMTNVSLPVFARCAVCYTKGLSGASIAVIVIVLSALFLFFANKFLQKFLYKNKI